MSYETRYLSNPAFNRTFVELKCRYAKIGKRFRTSFNRTFVELKCKQVIRKERPADLLIEPLWN